MLLAGDTSLWVLTVASGGLKQLPGGGASTTAMMFTPTGTHVSYVQDNDIYSVRLSDGQVQRLTSDGSDAVFNGCLDWVYNEEMATRAAQPGYAWSPDGKWLMYMRLDDSQVQNDPVTDYDPVPPTVSYTRYPTAGTPNPAVSMHALAPQESLPARDIPLPPDSEYVLPFYAWTPDSGEAMYITVNRDHTVLQAERLGPGERRGPRGHRGDGPRMDQRGLLRSAGLPAGRAALPLAVGARRLHAPLSLLSPGRAAAAVDRGGLAHRHHAL